MSGVVDKVGVIYLLKNRTYFYNVAEPRSGT